MVVIFIQKIVLHFSKLFIFLKDRRVPGRVSDFAKSCDDGYSQEEIMDFEIEMIQVFCLAFMIFRILINFPLESAIQTEPTYTCLLFEHLSQLLGFLHRKIFLCTKQFPCNHNRIRQPAIPKDHGAFLQALQGVHATD